MSERITFRENAIYAARMLNGDRYVFQYVTRDRRFIKGTLIEFSRGPRSKEEDDPASDETILIPYVSLSAVYIPQRYAGQTLQFQRHKGAI
jgi:hypothetical protein